MIINASLCKFAGQVANIKRLIANSTTGIDTDVTVMALVTVLADVMGEDVTSKGDVVTKSEWVGRVMETLLEERLNDKGVNAQEGHLVDE